MVNKKGGTPGRLRLLTAPGSYPGSYQDMALAISSTRAKNPALAAAPLNFQSSLCRQTEVFFALFLAQRFHLFLDSVLEGFDLLPADRGNLIELQPFFLALAFQSLDLVFVLDI